MPRDEVRFDGHRLIAPDGTVGEIAAWESQTVECADRVESVGPEVFEWQRRFSLRPGAPSQAVRLTLDFVATQEA